MNIIHALKTLPRLVDDALAARLRVMPAVVLTGARQTGKSTWSRSSFRASGATARSTTSTCAMPANSQPGLILDTDAAGSLGTYWLAMVYGGSQRPRGAAGVTDCPRVYA